MPHFRKEQLPVETSADGSTCDVFLGDAGHLTQFGAVMETLRPGAISALSHWHLNEDELIYVLEGEVTLHEGGEAAVLHPGDHACFAAGAPVGHFLRNEGDVPCRVLMVGTRAPADVITYPEHDRVCLRIRALADDVWLDGAGGPADAPY